VVAVGVPVMFGNCSGSKSLHGSNRIIGGRDWAARVPDLAAAINSSGCWVFGASEVHAPDDEWKDSAYPAGGHKYLEAALKALDPAWAIAAGAEGNWTYILTSRVSLVSSKNVHYEKAYDRGFTDCLVAVTGTTLQTHVLNTHFTAHDDKGHDAARARQARQMVAYAKKLGRAVWGGDINSSSGRKNYPRDIAFKAGWRGLRQRGSVVNGGLSSFSTNPKKDYWLDELFTRESEAVTGATLVLTNGVNGSKVITDHNWLKATVVFDTAASPYVAPALKPLESSPVVMPKPYSGLPWTATARDRELNFTSDIRLTTATLQENWNTPDMLTVTGTWAGLAPLFEAGAGVEVRDDQNKQRLTGPGIDIQDEGTRRGTVIFASDLIMLWERICYPDPTKDWKAQGTATQDVRVGTSEARLLAYINVNLGPGALDTRREPLLRLPASRGRGPIGTTSANSSQTLGDVCAALAEEAELRMRIVFTVDASGPHFDLVLDDCPDVSGWASFSTPDAGGPYLLDESWRRRIARPAATTILSIAGEETARILTERTDQDACDTWRGRGGLRIEQVLDQSGTTDVAEIAAGIDEAIASGAGPSEQSLPIGRAQGLGDLVPVGSLVGASVRGDDTVDRLRQITTTLARQQGQPTLTVTGSIGTPDGVLTPKQRQLAAALTSAKEGQRL